MKFRFYITTLFEGTIVGTDDETVAKDHAECEDFFVVDTKTGQMLLADGSLHDVRDVSDKED